MRVVIGASRYHTELVAANHGERRCPPTQRHEHGFRTMIARATRVIAEADPSVSVLGRPRFGRRATELRAARSVGAAAKKRRMGVT